MASATVNTRIENLNVDDEGVLAAKLTSTNRTNPKFEIKLDGWSKWKPAEANLRLGPLDPGERTLEARSFSRRGLPDPSPAVARFTVKATEPPPPPPPPPPSPEWKTLLDLSRVSAWDAIHESAPGAEISDQPDGSIRLYKPNPGERCEMSHHDERIGNGSTFRYSWRVRIDPVSVLDPGGTSTINQQHGDEKSGYGGGLVVRASDLMLILNVRGGKRISTQGSQRYEYQSDGEGGSPPAPNVEVGKVTKGQVHAITVEARWSKTWDGYVKVQLDDNSPLLIENVPTMCEPANVQMFYLGWYSATGPTPKDMKVWDALIEIPA